MDESTRRPSGTFMSFGIQGKVALLVIVATAASALLVAKVLTDRAAEVLREHELVDLGDEASLRGWVIIDEIDGLRDDLTNIAFNPEFQQSVEGADSPEDLKALARALCRRNWANRLRIDLVTLGSTSPPRVIHETGIVGKDDLWFPGPERSAGARMHFSPIQRVRLTRTDIPGDPLERWEPVIWAVAPLDRLDREADSAQTYVRILMTLHSPESPRHLFAMFDRGGHPLMRHDETEPPERGNDKIFLELSQAPELLDALEERRTPPDDPAKVREEPKVDRLLRTDFKRLASPYFFQEGIPGPKLSAALEAMDEDALELFLEDIQGHFGRKVRIGGMLSGVREVRLLAHSREELLEVRPLVLERLKTHFGANFDEVDWRGLVECDELHSWAVRLLIGVGEQRSEYLLHYAVLDDELASSIEYEMLTVQYLSVVVAGGFGLIGFFFAMRFIRPLKQMTLTAQKITESPRESLLREVAGLAQRLDLRRRDEVGDIARASKRLFEELISFQEELEQRVGDRTRELRRANIELERANEKLKTLSHEKDAFVAKVSHDLRQPLNAIFLQVEALKLSKLDETQQMDVQRIRDHAARELNLVNDILEYQKIIMGAETLHRNTVEAAPLLEELAATHRPSLGAKAVTLSAEYPPDIGELVADERRLRQILGNLLGNACKFTSDGNILLAARPQEIGGISWLEFTVTDTGRGMSPSEQSKAFVPFVSNKKDNAGGSGLGLSICRELVSQMGGKIGFVSELGKGTHFSVFLPRVPTSSHYDHDKDELADAFAPPIAEGEADGEDHRPGSTILVIDDDASVRDLLSRLLEKDGHRVLTAEDGPSGLALASESRPDAITLDVVMPGGMDGWEVLRLLKESPATRSIPVIMVSVMAEQEHALALEVEDYLVKPIDIERLGRAIHRATRQLPQRNLLLVDDDEDSLSLMSRLLGAAGWHTLTARNGIEALAALVKTRPAAIVLDLIMPEMDGFEFLQHLLLDPQLRSIPVIVMSGKDPTETEQAFLRDRVGAVMKKGSHSVEELLATVKSRLLKDAEE
jgi:signal transduction histidine kinase/CheY-like chemotaxis protein